MLSTELYIAMYAILVMVSQFFIKQATGNKFTEVQQLVMHYINSLTFTPINARFNFCFPLAAEEGRWS